VHQDPPDVQLGRQEPLPPPRWPPLQRPLFGGPSLSTPSITIWGHIALDSTPCHLSLEKFHEGRGWEIPDKSTVSLGLLGSVVEVDGRRGFPGGGNRGETT